MLTHDDVDVVQDDGVDNDGDDDYDRPPNPATFAESSETWRDLARPSRQSHGLEVRAGKLQDDEWLAGWRASWLADTAA